MRTLALLIVSVLFFASCSKDRLNGNGHIVSEERGAGSDFDKIVSSGSQRVYLTYGTEYSIELRGSSNLLPRFETDIRGNTLYLGFERLNVSDNDIEVFITVPSITSANLSGSGRIYFQGDFPAQDELKVRLSGSGSIRAKDPLEVENLEISISGSGDVDFRNAVCNDADVLISGSGTARVDVTNYLKARISGSGKIYYSGSPSIESEISGSGKVIKE